MHNLKKTQKLDRKQQGAPPQHTHTTYQRLHLGGVSASVQDFNVGVSLPAHAHSDVCANECLFFIRQGIRPRGIKPTNQQTLPTSYSLLCSDSSAATLTHTHTHSHRHTQLSATALSCSESESIKGCDSSSSPSLPHIERRRGTEGLSLPRLELREPSRAEQSRAEQSRAERDLSCCLA